MLTHPGLAVVVEFDVLTLVVVCVVPGVLSTDCDGDDGQLTRVPFGYLTAVVLPYHEIVDPCGIPGQQCGLPSA